MRNLVLFLALTLTASSVQAAESIVRARWDQLDVLIQGKKVKFWLPDGETVKVRVSAVAESGIRGDALSSSSRKKHPLGETTIPREAVAEMLVYRRGSKWTAIGAAAGVITGLVGGFAAANEGNYPMMWTIVGASSAAGTAVGWGADTKRTRFVVVRE